MNYNQNNYKEFAYYYDSLMDEAFYSDYANYLNDHFHFSSLIEFGCGTGRLLAYFKDIDILGIDLSDKMVEIAGMQDICCEVGDMQYYKPSKLYDLALCICDSLNYVLGFENQIESIVNMLSSVKPGGYLVLDINSEYKMDEILNDYLETEENEEFYFYWKVKKTALHQVTHYLIVEDKVEDIRFEEKHIQESYPLEEYLNRLNQLGIKDIEVDRDFFNNERIILKIKK